jgi:23S rRNA pseudouridine1911/1915/1917 synthase
VDTPNSIHITARVEDSSLRLDKFLAARLPDVSRSRIQDWLGKGCIQLNGLVAPCAHYKMRVHDVLEITPPPVQEATPHAQAIPLAIVYEDAHLIVINKPAGLVVHPAPGHYDNTLVNALLAHCGDTLSGIGGVRRPGIVHRLDKDTTGLMVIAKHDKAHQHLAAQFQYAKGETLKRLYHVLVWGRPMPFTGTVDIGIARHPHSRQKMAPSQGAKGKRAITHYKTLQSWGPLQKTNHALSLIECNLHTGRTHQIRVHMQWLKTPVVGDPLYGPKNLPAFLPQPIKAFKRQALHACGLEFIHPHTGEVMAFTAPLPADMQALIDALSTPHA